MGIRLWVYMGKVACLDHHSRVDSSTGGTKEVVKLLFSSSHQCNSQLRANNAVLSYGERQIFIESRAVLTCELAVLG